MCVEQLQFSDYKHAGIFLSPNPPSNKIIDINVPAKSTQCYFQ